MALCKEKVSQYGVTAGYWRIIRVTMRKHGGEPLVNISVEIGLYLDKAHSDSGQGALETVTVTLSDAVAAEPLNILEHCYTKLKAGEYDFAVEQGVNQFAGAEDC